MKNKSPYLKICIIAVSIIAWVVLWWFAASKSSLNYLFPTPVSTFKALGSLIITANFWKTVFNTILRILSGLLLGIVFGIAVLVSGDAAPFFAISVPGTILTVLLNRSE